MAAIHQPCNLLWVIARVWRSSVYSFQSVFLMSFVCLHGIITVKCNLLNPSLAQLLLIDWDEWDTLNCNQGPWKVEHFHFLETLQYISTSQCSPQLLSPGWGHVLHDIHHLSLLISCHLCAVSYLIKAWNAPRILITSMYAFIIEETNHIHKSF